MAESRLQELNGAGVSAWIDSLSREMLHSGSLAALMGRMTLPLKTAAAGRAGDDRRPGGRVSARPGGPRRWGWPH